METCRSGVAPSDEKCQIEGALSLPFCGLETLVARKNQEGCSIFAFTPFASSPTCSTTDSWTTSLSNDIYKLDMSILLDPDDTSGGPLQWVQSALEASSARSNAQIAKSQSQKNKRKPADCRKKLKSSQFECGEGGQGRSACRRDLLCQASLGGELAPCQGSCGNEDLPGRRTHQHSTSSARSRVNFGDNLQSRRKEFGKSSPTSQGFENSTGVASRGTGTQTRSLRRQSSEKALSHGHL